MFDKKKWICFAASASLLNTIITSGIYVTKHPLTNNFLLPASISEHQLRELTEQDDFKFLSLVVQQRIPNAS